MASMKIPDNIIETYRNILKTEKELNDKLAYYWNSFSTACKQSNIDPGYAMAEISKILKLSESKIDDGNRIDDRMVRRSIINFIGERAINDNELFRFFNVIQQNTDGLLINPEWFNNHSNLVEGIIMNGRKVYQLTQRGKRYKEQSDVVGGIMFHPDNITNDKGWCDEPSVSSSAPAASPPASPGGGSI